MDTSTHFVMGIGLAGLAYIDPVVAADPMLAAAVMVGTIAGSQAPDIDTALRFKSNSLYIRNHRGMSHSLPFLMLWVLMITGVIGLIFSGIPLAHVVLWTAVAVGVHVFTDLFNTYGTQAARPFTERWIAWNVIHIFDPFLFTTHVIAILLWAFDLVQPAPLFTALYILIGVYYIWRTIARVLVVRKVKQMDNSPEIAKYIVIPTISWSRWHVVKTNKDGSYELGKIDGNELTWSLHATSSTHAAVAASRKLPEVSAFLYFTSYAVAEVEELPAGYKVRWADVRYRHRKQYPFVAVVVMDRNFETIDTYVGWLSDEKMDKKLLSARP
ncbi:metal-dependent hydrolase [Paenibacillus barcinonensis]|uniref:Inner membrane protein n=1 Tax=Paenibacillus barcinonensis TaxID=198119 RepID=A0A2V4VTN2_PAEBA|nr:metal-dependent hydrolase [Paenibacillus barcinonensis]PYE48172.1 inner membrane protein [Paenibacillus barcinonensis]QKS56971.1 metal-dependent hydrolase [Paenibacillus barcinonensis]